MKHLLSIESLTRSEILSLIASGHKLKAERGHHTNQPLHNQCWGLLFSKSSTRTRVSFEVGIRELGGSVLFLSASEIQLGRGEPIKDTARVLGRMIHGAVIRTFAQEDVDTFAAFSGIPTINALTDEEHPCQILADLLTMEEAGLDIQKVKICFVGDGDCNVARSWIWAAAHLGFELRIAAPRAYQPSEELIERAQGNILVLNDPLEAAEGVDVLYTDVWVSMGKEEEASFRQAQLQAYQINRTLVDLAASHVRVMHCLPAYRGKEITDEILEENAESIFTQAENRLHVQKAILCSVI